MSKRALWTAALVAVLGTWGYIGNAAADCIVPLSGSAADSADLMYFVRGADTIYRFTVQNTNANTIFGFTSATLPANPFVAAVDTTVPANGFADSLGNVTGFTNAVPYTTFPQGPSGATEPVCHQFCPGGVNPSPTTGPCVTEIMVTGGDGNIYRCAFKETNAAGVFAGAHASLGVFASGDTGGSAGDAAGNEDGFNGVHATTSCFIKITQ